ncbi:MAG: thiolase domain-containing protein, partial [Dongiaceae bacterium]
MAGCIIGWGHTKFGRHAELRLEDLIKEAGAAALADAGVEAKDIDAIFVGHFNAGFSDQDFPASLALEIDPALRFKPATRLENACATGSAAVHAGLDAIEARRARFVLVVGVEKMTHRPGPEIGANLLKASYVAEEAGIEAGFAGVFGLIAQRYFQRFGDKSDALARIAAKNHRNGAANPYAQLRNDLGYEFCRAVSEKNPIVAGPLKRTDCSPVSDGAAAVVLTDLETALACRKAIRFRATAQVNDWLPMSRRDVVKFEGAAAAWRQALERARLGIETLDLVETHDCFTIAELIEYEAMGLTAPGEGARAIEEGWTE